MSAIPGVSPDRRRSYVAAATLVSAAWLALAAWSLSPYAEWLDHARMDHLPAPAVVRLGVFALGWALMVVAMMLPGTLGVLLAHRPADRAVHLRVIAPLVLTYVGVWTIFGAASYLGDTALHEVVEHNPALAGVVAPSLVLAAGLYQLTPMKRAALLRCCAEGTKRHDMGLASHGTPWAAGLRYGLYCLGSCWALMLLMFAVGRVNLLWMLALSAIMAAERLNRRGREVARLLGVALIVASVMLAVV